MLKQFHFYRCIETTAQESRESTPEVFTGIYKQNIFAGPARLTCFTQGKYTFIKIPLNVFLNKIRAIFLSTVDNTNLLSFK